MGVTMDVAETGPPGSDEKRPRMSGDQRRAAFLDAAAAIVLEKGASAVTMDGVALRTGVNKRLGYRYFPNRQALLRALTDRELDEVARRARACMPHNATLEQRVGVDIRAWLEVVQERGPLLARLRFGQDAPAEIGLERPVQEWTDIIRGSFAMPEATAEILARLLLAALRGASDALERRRAPLEQIATIYTSVAIASVHRVAAESLRTGA